MLVQPTIAERSSVGSGWEGPRIADRTSIEIHEQHPPLSGITDLLIPYSILIVGVYVRKMMTWG